MSSTSTTTSQIDSTRTFKLPSGQTIAPISEVAIDSDEIPIIDISSIWSFDLEAKKAVAEQVREASCRIGFFYAKGHGIDPSLADAVFRQGEKFCALPMEKKLEVDTAKIPDKYVGYHPLERYNRNQRKRQDLSEAFNWAYEPSHDPLNSEDEKKKPGISMWPDEDACNLPGFKADLMAYHTELLTFARRLTGIFALALGMDETYFDEYTRHPEAGMRVIHYPEQEVEAVEQNGIGAHTDFECFTAVTQDATPSGLEVLSKRTNRWIRCPPVPGTLVINIADCLMRQTNDYFVSTVHRVVNRTGRERYSVPFFFGFDGAMALQAVPTCVGEGSLTGRPMRYPVLTSGEYYEYRARTAKEKQT